MGVVELIVGACLLYASGGLLACCLRLRSTVSFLLAANVVALALLVVFTLGLSPFHLVDRTWTWAWLVLAFAGSLACWLARARPAPPIRALASIPGIARAEPLVAILLGLDALAFAYIAALAVGTPENEGDALTYHVPRAAFWHQQHAVHYIANAVDSRLNVSPPNEEIGLLFTMILSGGQTLVGLVQVGALAVCVVATVGLARRLGLAPAAALFAGLLVVTFPVVATQGWTALNDLGVASLLATAAYFVLGETRSELALAGLALGLALGTKLTAVLSVPLLILVVLFAPGGRRAARGAWLFGVAAITGSSWYIVNVVKTGSFDGRLAGSAQQTPHSVATMLGTLQRFMLNALDLSGSSFGSWHLVGDVGARTFAYRAAGVVLVVLGLIRFLGRDERRDAWRFVGAGIFVAVAPALVHLVYRAVYQALTPHGQPVAPFPNLAAGATLSWFGPLGSLILVAGIAIAWQRSRIAALYALAPVILALSLSVSVVWDPWRGRFFVFGYLLAAASWGLLFRYRWLASAVAAIACATLVLSLANADSKPSGAGWLGSSGSTVWGMPTVETEGLLRSGSDDDVVLRVAAQRIPAHANLAVAPAGNDFLSPYFGAQLGRHVSLVLARGTVPRQAAWLIEAPGVRPGLCGYDWRTVATTRSGWRVARRVAYGACATDQSDSPTGSLSASSARNTGTRRS